MKKKTFLIIFSIALIVLGGVYLKKQIEKSQLISEEGPRIEKYLRYNYKDINSVTFTNVKVNPTGIPHITGYVNNHKDMNFNAGIYKNHFSRALDFFEKKPEFKSNNGEIKSIEEIDKEEK
ncbi:DUF1433 domain-containing protein [uncultured Vagococcus sp.]|uniref:DUF1433 domain-containing protein n=1 Tax=uncultured Vagococcus sp. TaxID=189676 RepID=UPI0028D8E6FF|nr:DUF1433 domain-containing protein [uncultured Vagococcus sp.]